MRIKEIDLHRIRIPLSKPYYFGRGLVDNLESIIIRIEDEKGFVGIGECVVRLLISSADTAENKLLHEFIPAIIGMDSMDIESIVKKLQP